MTRPSRDESRSPPLRRRTSEGALSRRAMLAATLAVTGCFRARPKSREVTRIISLSPSTTETVFALGAGLLLVGRSRYCNFPGEVLSIPSVGGFVDPSLEAILALSPDLVVGAHGPQGGTLVDKLQSRGIPTYFPRTESFAEIREMIEGLALRLNRSKEATSLVTRMADGLAKVEASTPSGTRPRVLLVFGIEPIVGAGPGGFPDEMIRLAGAENILKDGPRYPSLGFERVLALDPDVLLHATMAEPRAHAAIASRTGPWASLSAVKKGRVYSVNGDEALRPGPRIVEGVWSLSQAIHRAVTP